MQTKQKLHLFIVILIISSMACAPLRTLFPVFSNDQTGSDDPPTKSAERASSVGEDESTYSLLPQDGNPLNVDLVQRGETNSKMIGENLLSRKMLFSPRLKLA